VLDATLVCDRQTVLVGKNGSGKSTFLRALELFYAPNPYLSPSDFFEENYTEPIDITVVFGALSASASAQFAAYVQGNELAVTRVLTYADGKTTAKYYGSTLRHEPFQEIRDISGARDLTKAYNALRVQQKYSFLPEATKKDDAIAGMQAWEEAHSEECTRQRDEGQFFGFTEVAQGYLGKYTRLIRIPAVRDAASDASDERKSPITQLMDLVVRGALAAREDFVKLKAEIEDRYSQIIDPSKSPDLAALTSSLTETLRAFVPESSVEVDWSDLPAIDLALPRATVRLSEDGYLCPVERAGHGTQRAFIITLLQHLAMGATPSPATARSAAQAGGDPILPELDQPGLVLLIEEPELYQHPTRQRHFASLLSRLSSGNLPGVASSTQVLYCTHSPLFVQLEYFDQIRLVRKDPVPGTSVKASNVGSASLAAVAHELWSKTAPSSPAFTAETLRPRLAAVMTPWVNEGFFADLVVLVEGESDRAALLAVAGQIGYDFDAEGISVVPCMGKPNLDRPLVVFRALGIPTYVMWDSDEGAKDPKPERNRSLLRLLNRKEQDWPDYVDADSACLVGNLERVLEAEIGNVAWNELLLLASSETGLPAEKARKNPLAISEIIRTAYRAGKAFPSLEAVARSIWTMRHPVEQPSVPLSQAGPATPPSGRSLPLC